MAGGFGRTSLLLTLLALGACTGNRDALTRAIKTRDDAALAALLDKGVSTETRLAFGRRPLHLACENGNANAVTLLLKAGARVDTRDGRGATPLQVCADQGFDGLALMLLGRGAPIDAMDGNGNTPLIDACMNGKVRVVAVLLQNGADPRLKNKFGMTAASLAKQWGHDEIVYLLERRSSGSK